ncbi:MAG: GTP-binding protein [Hyphomonadaceae bacterium]
MPCCRLEAGAPPEQRTELSCPSVQTKITATLHHGAHRCRQDHDDRAILFYSGQEPQDRRSPRWRRATMDWMEQEQERGIDYYVGGDDVLEGQAPQHYRHPGHVDFTIEVERCGCACRRRFVVVSTATKALSRRFKRSDAQGDKYKVPRIIFANKMDKTGATSYMRGRHQEAPGRKRPVLLQLLIGYSESGFKGIVDLVEMNAIIWKDESLGAKFDIVDIPDDLKDKAVEYRNNLIEAAVEPMTRGMESIWKAKNLTSRR